MSAMPFFSVIIPTKARPAMVDIALHSLHHQTFSDFEVIVTDDYDDEALSCKPIVEKYQDERFVYVHPPDEPVLGMCGNWEYGLQFAKGRYIGFMQDKMYMYAESLQSLHTCIMQEEFPDMVNWGWDFYDLNTKDDGSLGGVLYRQDWTGTWEQREPEGEIQKKLEFSQGNYQFPGGIPGSGSLLGGIIKNEILQRVKYRYGNVFNFFNPDYGPPLLLLSEVESLIFHHNHLFVAIPLQSSEGLRHSVSYEAACQFQQLSPCGVERLQYATVPYLRITNTNMISADYNYTMFLLGREDRCEEENVLCGILRDVASVRYEQQEYYEQENASLKKFCHDRGIPFVDLPLYSEEASSQSSTESSLKGQLKKFFFKYIPRRFQPSLRNRFASHDHWLYCHSPKDSIVREGGGR